MYKERYYYYKKITRLLTLILCVGYIILYLITPLKVQAAEAEKKYLVLVQNSNRSWTAYEDMIEPSPQKKLMIKAKPIAEALRFDYINFGDGEFIIQRGDFRYNSYERNSASYVFQSSSTLSVNKTASNVAYYSDKSGCNLCHISTLRTIINYRYFTGSEIADYRKAGYTSIVCYSRYQVIDEAPDIREVYDTEGDKFFSQDEPDTTDQIISSAINLSEEDERQLIIVGDSRTNNMSKWVSTTVNTQFIAKSGEGYLWFEQNGIEDVNMIKNPGDVIVIWLGVNDYFSNALGTDPWKAYSQKINELAATDWADCSVYVAEVGYVDTNYIYNYNNKITRANVSQINSPYKIQGIQEFNKKLRNSLSQDITWINTNDIIGIKANDTDLTPEELWVVRSNGMVDGLHYGVEVSQKVYNHFVNTTMN